MISDRLLNQLRRKRFLSIGRAGMDFYAEPPGVRLEQADTFSAHVGGSAGNIAVALAKLGCTSEIITCFSDDAVGRFAINKLHGFGVNTARSRNVGGEARNSLAVVETRLNDCQSVIYRNGAADFLMDMSDIERIDFTNSDAIILSGTALADEPSRSAILRAIDLARATETLIIIDMDYRPYSWVSAEEAKSVYSSAISQCDIVIGNDVEFGVAAGDHSHGFDYATSLVKGTPEIVIYKKGELGSTTITDSGSFDTGVFPVQALKPTGAGDAFMGGFVAGLANGLDLQEAVIQGSASAAIVVTRVACSSAMPTQDELSHFLTTSTLTQN